MKKSGLTPRTVFGVLPLRSITKRRAAVLVGGDKSGVGEKRFYRQLLAKADERFAKHLAGIKAEEGKKR